MDSQQSLRSTIILRDFLAAPHNQEAFGRFASKYRPRIKDRCSNRWGLQDADADDLTSALLLKFFERDVFREFVFQSKEQFNGWLNTVVRNAVLTFLRDRGRKPDAWSVGNPDAQDSLEHVISDLGRDLEAVCAEDLQLVQRARDAVRGRVEGDTWQAFCLQADEGKSAEEVGQQLGKSNYAVWKAHSRVMRLLREEFHRLQGPDGQET